MPGKGILPMSVVEPERHGNRLLVHVKAQELASYTAEILKNPKTFNPEVDTELISRIRGCAYDIYAKLWSANRIRSDTNGVNRAWRYGLQEEAILTCDENARLYRNCDEGVPSAQQADEILERNDHGSSHTRTEVEGE